LDQALIAFEYELPGEAGRRPDVVLVLPSGHLLVIELKDRATVHVSDLDQVTAYARDLTEYQSASHGLRAHSVLALTKTKTGAKPIIRQGVTIDWPTDSRFAGLEALVLETLDDIVAETAPQDWLMGEYAPLPSLIRAAVDTFRRNPLPHIKSVRASRVPHVLEWINSLTAEMQQRRQHALVIITGTPGSGKTLIGLQAVVDQADSGVKSLYISGNGPLVAVLQDALDRLTSDRPARSLMRGMMELKRYATRSAAHAPAEFYVFDEGQRAWTTVSDYPGSEIQLLIDVASRREWGVVVALIGIGQEIWQKEQGDIQTWARDFLGSNRHGRQWNIFAADELAPLIATGAGPDVKVHQNHDLHLDRSLRSKRILELHNWIDAVLSPLPGSAAKPVAGSLHESGFPIYVTRSRHLAEGYVRGLYEQIPDKSFGWVASSQSTSRIEGLDVLPLLKTRFTSENPRVYGGWFNSVANDPRSSRSLREAAKEFSCQGLELDFVLMQWGMDLVWRNASWHVPSGTRRRSERPREHTFNAYRVLLSRAREGFVIHCRDSATIERLQACGVVLLEDAERSVAA
jgi:Schlafen group 3, DNA/RNA helicase domain